MIQTYYLANNRVDGGIHMSLDQRSTFILTQLLHARSYLPIQELTQKLNVSRRTVYNDLEKINSWLEEQGLKAVYKVRSQGLILDERAKEEIPTKLRSLKSWHYEYSAQERKAWVVIYLLTRLEPLFLEHLMDRTGVSRNTTIDDIKCLKDELNNFHLALEFERKDGYTISGDETDKRKALVYYLSQALPQQNWETELSPIRIFLRTKRDNGRIFTIEELQKVYDVISESEKVLKIQYTDDVLHSLSLRFLLFMKRVAKGKFIKVHPLEKQVLKGTKEYEAAKVMSFKLEQAFGVHYPDEEVLYLTTHILSSKINYANGEIESRKESQELTHIVTSMVNDFQKYACVVFEEKELLEKNLFFHIKPAFYRIKYGLEVENNIAESIKTSYPELFLLTRKVVHYLERYVGKSVNDNEVAFITMHFVGWMRREGTIPTKRKKALIVCANGVGTSQFLKNQLEGLFPAVDIIKTCSIREYEKTPVEVDFIISTTSIPEKNVPIFIVNPILTETEKERLLKSVHAALDELGAMKGYSIEGLMDVIKRHGNVDDEKALYQDLRRFFTQPTPIGPKQEKPDLNQLLTEDMIQLREQVTHWQEAIQLAAKPLLLKGMVTESYVKKMIKNIEKFGPYMIIAPHFAIPHAKPEDGVRQLGMSLLWLKKPVTFSSQKGHDVHVIVVLASVDSNKHLKALSQLTHLMSKKETMETLMTVHSKQTVMQMIDAT